jgi:hypothetical protein
VAEEAAVQPNKHQAAISEHPTTTSNIKNFGVSLVRLPNLNVHSFLGLLQFGNKRPINAPAPYATVLQISLAIGT